MLREMFKTCLARDGQESTKMWWLFSFYIRCSQLTMSSYYICENIDLVKLWLEAVTGCLLENRCLKAIKSNLKLNQIPWKINKKIIINNTAILQPTTLLKMNSLMNLFWQLQYFSSILLNKFWCNSNTIFKKFCHISRFKPFTGNIGIMQQWQ